MVSFSSVNLIKKKTILRDENDKCKYTVYNDSKRLSKNCFSKLELKYAKKPLFRKADYLYPLALLCFVNILF